MVMILSNTKSKTEPYVCQKKCDIQGVLEIAKQLKAWVLLNYDISGKPQNFKG